MPTVPSSPDGRLLSDDEVFGQQQPSSDRLLTDAEVFSPSQQDTSTRVRASARLAEGMNPQQVLEAERLGSQYGLPTDVVQRQLPEVRRAAEADRLDRLLYGSPRVAQFVSEAPENLAVARDDVEQLTLLERLMAGYNPEDLPEGLQTAGAVVQGGLDIQRAWTGSVVSGAGSFIRGVAEVPGVIERQSQRAVSGLIGLASDELSAQYDQQMAENRARLPWWLTPDLATEAGQTIGGGIADFGAAIGPPETRQNVVTDLAAGGGSLATYLAVGAATGGAGVVVLGAGQGMDLQAQRAREAGTYGTAEADAAIGIGATVTAATERLGIGFLMRRLPPSVREGLNRRVADIIMSGAAEGTQEVTEKLVQDTVTRVLVDDSFEVMEGWQQDGAMGFALGALFRGGVHVVRGQADAALAQSERSQVESIGRVVDGLQLGQQDPSRLRGLLARLTTAGREDVYVPVSEFQTLFQSTQEIDAALDAAGMDRGDYAQALLSNGRVRIPTAGFFTSFTPEQRGKLYPVARWTPNGMTPAEAESYDPEAALADYMAAVGEQGRPADDPANRVYEDIRQQLEAAGATPDVAAAQAEQFAAFVRTQAAREGVSVDTIIGAQGQERVRVTSPVDPRVQAVWDGPQGDPMIDAVIDAARAGRTFSDRQVRGTRLVSMLVGRGGLRADAFGADSVRAMDGQMRPGLLRTSGEGMTLDDALRVAREAGYIDQPLASETDQYDPNGPDINTLLDLIADDLSGVSPVFASGDVNLDREAFNQSVEGLLQELDERGIGREQLDGMTNAQVRDLLGLNRTEAEARFDQRPAVEYVAEVKGETWRLTDSPAPPGTDYSEFGEIRIVRAFDGERLVGRLVYGNDGTPPTVEVAGAMRRRNIGTAMMALAEKQGGILGDPETGIRGRGAEYRTPDGQAFRRGADTSQVKLTLVGPVRLNQSAQGDDYRIEHRAPTRDSGAPAHDVTGGGNFYPDDVYGPRGAAFYGTGSEYDKQAFRIINSLRGKPDEMVAIFRAVPNDAPSEFNPGDWVAITRGYAKDHGESVHGRGNYIILSKTVKASEIFTNGDSIQEWGYDDGTTTLYQSAPSGEDGSPENPLPPDRQQDAPVGAWVRGPEIPGVAPFLYQIREVPLDQIDATELQSDGDIVPEKRRDADAYAERMRAGEMDYPNGRGSELESGKIKLQDGHRRYVALRAIGSTTMRLAVDPIDQPNPTVGSADGPTPSGVSFNQSAPSDAGGAAGGAAEAFRGVTREQFLGSPKIIAQSNSAALVPKALTTVAEAAPEPFLGSYAARYSEDGVAVYDGDRVIASYNFGDTLVVDKKYRRQGIAEEMVYQWRTRNPSAKTASTRTKASQSLQEKVWARIQRELRATASASILEQRQGDTARGSIEIQPAGYPGGVRQFVINLGETRDFSTFLHESGHFYLEVMRESNARLRAADPATLTPSQRQLLEDHAALLRELGVGSFDAIQTIHHERFAETYEAYLREGRAPSTRLQRAFQKFGAWLKMIYSSLRRLPNARINDQTRAIMDRMLATDDEIEAARQAQGLQALFETPEAAGMDEAEFGRYQEAVRASRQAAIDAEAAEQYRYERAEAKRWRTSVMAELILKATRAMNDVPVYRALSNMRRGKMPDGSDLPAGERQIKLSSELVNDVMGPGWAGRNLAGAVAADGKAPDLVAAVFGFASGRDLITALANAPKMKDAIRAEADRLWRETYPDPMLDGELADRVQGRVHNDAQADVMAREIAALERKVPGDRRSTPLEVMRGAAERIARDTVVGKLNPQQHKHAEAKAGREALKAAAAQDWEAALRARRQQLFSGLMFKATMDAKERADEIRGHMAKLAKKPAQERFARAGWEAYLDKVNQILRAFDFRRMSARELERRKSLRAWVEAQQEEGDVTAIPEALLERVEAERVQNWKEVRFSELEAAYDAVRNIEHLARLKNKLLAADDRRNRDEAIEDMVARAEEALPDVLPQGASRFDLSLTERASAKLRTLANTFDRPENVIEALDGGEAGPWHDYFWGALSKAEDKVAQLRREIGGKLKALRKADPSVLAEMNELVAFKGVQISRATLMSAVLNTGNAGNLQRLMDGGMVDAAGRVMKLTDADVAQMRGMLTAAELRYIQGLWDTVNGLWPEVVALTRRMSGLPPEKVEAQEFVVRSADGTEVRMAGGYWPAVYDFRRSAVGDRQVSDDALQMMMGQGYSKAATPKGHTKERAAQVNAPLLLDFSAVMSRHLDQVMTDIAYREAVKDTMSLLQDQRVRSTIVNRLGEEVYTNLRGVVAYTVSASNVVAGQTAQPVHRVLDQVMTNLTIGALAIRPDIALGNYTSALVQGLDRTGLRGLARGLAVLYMPGQRAKMDARIRELSPFMAQRLDDTDYNYQQEMARAAGKRAFGPAYRRVMMTLHRMADFEVTRALWWGRYQIESERGATSEEAARLADKSIRQTQTAQGRKDASLFERDPGFRQSRQFMGPMFVIFGRMLAAKRGQGAASAIGPRAATLLFQVFFAPALFALMAGRWPAEDGDDDDEEIGVGEWSVWLAANTLLFPLQTLPFIRDAGAAIEASITGNQINARLSPIGSAVENTGRALASVADQLEERELGGEVDYLEMTRDVTVAVAPLTGAPVGQVRITTRTIEYLQDNPEAGDVELARLALYGPPRE